MFKKKKTEIDDGINFQWGDKYICSEEIIEGVGGKYWKWNSDGSITEYKPQELRIKAVAQYLNESFLFKVKKKDCSVLEFNTEADAFKAAHEVNSSMFFATRSVEAVLIGKKITLSCILKGVMEARYFPSKGPNASS